MCVYVFCLHLFQHKGHIKALRLFFLRPIVDSLNPNSHDFPPFTSRLFSELRIYPRRDWWLSVESRQRPQITAHRAPLGRKAVNCHWTINHNSPAFHYWKELTSVGKRLQPWLTRTQRKFVSLRDDRSRFVHFPSFFWQIHTCGLRV